MIGLWLALVTVLSVTFTPLGQMARDHSNQEVLPSNSAVTMATRQMTKAFREPGIQNIALVVLTDYRGMSNADENVYRTLVDKLRRDKRDIVMMQDFVSQPPLRQVVTSKDNKAWFLPVGIAGEYAAAVVRVQLGVRTITVPALAALIGKANWWPSGWRQKPRLSKRPSKRRASARMAVRGVVLKAPAIPDGTAWLWSARSWTKWLRQP